MLGCRVQCVFIYFVLSSFSHTLPHRIHLYIYTTFSALPHTPYHDVYVCVCVCACVEMCKACKQTRQSNQRVILVPELGAHCVYICTAAEKSLAHRSFICKDSSPLSLSFIFSPHADARKVDAKEDWMNTGTFYHRAVHWKHLLYRLPLLIKAIMMITSVR